jgi:hypothetical protein
MTAIRTVIVAAALVLALGACGRDEEPATGAGNALLDYVPADTPYLAANSNRCPGRGRRLPATVQPVLDEMQTQLSKARAELESQDPAGVDDDPGERLALALLRELDGKLSREGLNSLGLDIRSHSRLASALWSCAWACRRRFHAGHIHRVLGRRLTAPGNPRASRTAPARTHTMTRRSAVRRDPRGPPGHRRPAGGGGSRGVAGVSACSGRCRATPDPPGGISTTPVTAHGPYPDPRLLADQFLLPDSLGPRAGRDRRT